MGTFLAWVGWPMTGLSVSLLLLACLAAPLYAVKNALTIARMITGFYGALFVCVAIAGATARSK